MTEYETKDSGVREEYDSGMQRDTQAGKPRFDLIIPAEVPYEEQLLTRWAALMARGAAHYGDRNWEKGNGQAELERARASALRHFMQWFTGETDEDHAAATLFNIQAVEYFAGRLEKDELDTPLAAKRKKVSGQLWRITDNAAIVMQGLDEEFECSDCDANFDEDELDTTPHPQPSAGLPAGWEDLGYTTDEAPVTLRKPDFAGIQIKRSDLEDEGLFFPGSGPWQFVFEPLQSAFPHFMMRAEGTMVRLADGHGPDNGSDDDRIGEETISDPDLRQAVQHSLDRDQHSL
jgi:hypothetical protein